MSGDEQGVELALIRTDGGEEQGASLVVSGDVDAHTAYELRRALDEAGSDGGTVHLDLGAVTFMDSSGLAAVISGFAQLRHRGGSVQIDAASPAVARLFRIAGVDGQLWPASG